MIELYNGDCLFESDKIKSGSVDLILTDLPYGNMNTDGGRKLGINGWDLAIEPKKVYEIANRILRKNGKMVLFSQEPYTSRLINEAIPNIPFNYRATWEKDNFANALGCNKNMVSFTEDILVFSKLECYSSINPLRKIMFEYISQYGFNNLYELFLKEGRYKNKNSAMVHLTYKFGYSNGMRFDLMDKKMYDYLNPYISFKETYEELEAINNKYKEKYSSTFNLWEGKKYKSNILKYKKDYDGHHPTQKPVLLLEDLIKTFSNEGDLIVDLTMGSGSCGVASVNTNRNFIGVEMEETYFNIAQKRINEI